MAPEPKSLGADQLACLDEGSINDIKLVGNDGIEISANRAMLAPRSPVLMKTLYGSFKEGSSDVIPLTLKDCNSKVIRAAVEFCYSDDIILEEMHEKTEEAARQLVRLCRFAEVYDIPSLRSKAGKLKDSLITSNPEHASVIYQEASTSPLESDDWRKAAWGKIIETPRVLLELMSSRETRGLLEDRDLEAMFTEVLGITPDYSWGKRKWEAAIEERRKRRVSEHEE